jgi:hypothetical protein
MEAAQELYQVKVFRKDGTGRDMDSIEIYRLRLAAVYGCL